MRRVVLLTSTLAALPLMLAAQAVPSQAAAAKPRPAGAETQVSSDPYTNATAEHATEVEPDTIAVGQSVMSVFQVGRFSSGCSDDQGWAFSSDAGKTWSHGYMPDLTTASSPPGKFSSVSDPVVAHNAKYGEWIASSLDCTGTAPASPSVSVSTSADGTDWNAPVVVATKTGTEDFDKDWITCDNTAASPFYGNCYAEWDIDTSNELVLMSTSTDGGKTWSTPASTASKLHGIGGEPVVLPDGNVVVPIFSASGSVVDFLSTDGGKTWGTTHTITTLTQQAFPGNLRGDMFPGVGVDGAGRIYLAWPDCRFRTGCTSNDMVMTTSTNGTSWTPVVRIPISAVTSTVDALGGGMGVDASTSGATARLGLYYYFYPKASCTRKTCQLDIGFTSSVDGGAQWSAPQTVAGPMKLSELPATSSGRMVGDYAGGAVVPGGNAFAALAVGAAPTGAQKFNEAMEDVSGGELLTGGSHIASASGAHVTAVTKVPVIAR